LIVSGSLQALHLISIGMLEPNSTIYTEKLSYIRSLGVFQSAKMNLTGIPMDEDGILPTMIEGGAKGTSLLYTIPTFHNPTGTVMPAKRRIELLEWCSINRIPIIEDDAYRELWFEQPPPPPLKALDENGNVLYMGSISKSLAPGFRIGWLVGPEAVIEHLGDIKMQLDYGASSISQWALTELIESGRYEKHLQTVRVKLTDRRNIALSALDSYFKEIATWNIPQGGFYIWLKLRPKVNMYKLFHLAAEQNLLINPGSIYDYADNQYLRISYSYAETDELTDGLKRLSELVKTLSKTG
jgi:GntR family transcriptional regulator of abcA and norABC